MENKKQKSLQEKKEFETDIYVTYDSKVIELMSAFEKYLLFS